jgi:putative flippase GtrA
LQPSKVPFLTPSETIGNSTGGEGRSSPSADVGGRVVHEPPNVSFRIARRVLESQFLRFCAVGASGYAVNLAVYAALLAAGLHYLAAAAISFLVAAASNYAWNRIWTFETSGAPLFGQGMRALLVSALSLGANQLFLIALVAAGAGHLAAQAAAIVLVTPFSFTANKLWAFAESAPAAGEPVREKARR